MTGPQRPSLAGRSVVITRDEGADGPLARALAARGARVVRWRSTRVAPPADPAPLAAALARLARYDWLVARARASPARSRRTPRRAPRRCASPRWARRRRPSSRGPGGASTSSGRVRAPRRWSRRSPAPASARGTRVLFPASALAGEELERGLAALGTEVERVEAYSLIPAPLDGEACRAQLARGELDGVVFASPSAVAGVAAALGQERFAEQLARVAVAAIGPTTSAALAAHGRPADAEASAATFEALADALVDALARRSPSRAAADAAGAPR
jgi:uroporphyrinogen-III synthase